MPVASLFADMVADSVLYSSRDWYIKKQKLLFIYKLCGNKETFFSPNCIMVDFPIDKSNMDWLVHYIYFKGSHNVFLSLNILFTLINNADPNEMLHVKLVSI